MKVSGDLTLCLFINYPTYARNSACKEGEEGAYKGSVGRTISLSGQGWSFVAPQEKLKTKSNGGKGLLGPWRPKDHLSRGLCSAYSVDKWTTREKTLDIVNIPQNPENKPRGLHFSKALFEGLVFGGAYLWREICVSKSIGLALRLEGNLPFLLCFTFYFEGNFQVQTPGGLIFGGAI